MAHETGQQLAMTVIWHVVGLWMCNEVGGGRQQVVQLTWEHLFPGLLMLMLPSSLSSSSWLLSSCACVGGIIGVEVVALLRLGWQHHWG